MPGLKCLNPYEVPQMLAGTSESWMPQAGAHAGDLGDAAPSPAVQKLGGGMGEGSGPAPVFPVLGTLGTSSPLGASVSFSVAHRA